MEPSGHIKPQASINIIKEAEASVLLEYPYDFNLRILLPGETQSKYLATIAHVKFHIQMQNQKLASPWTYSIQIGESHFFEYLPEDCKKIANRIFRFQDTILNSLMKYATSTTEISEDKENSYSFTVYPTSYFPKLLESSSSTSTGNSNSTESEPLSDPNIQKDSI